MKVPLRLVLPVVMGVISSALIVWDIHNQHVILSMGIAWDDGAPLWPYQTPDTLLLALNAPAYLLARPVSWLLGLLVPRHYLVLFPSIILWWWIAGRYIDQRPRVKAGLKAPIQALFLYLLAGALTVLAADGLIQALRWWWCYSRSLLNVTDLILLRLVAPSLWFFVLSFVAVSVARRRTRS